MLAIDNLTIRIAGREILAGASANLPGGRRIGLVGRNGAGKSTLLKVIQGELRARRRQCFPAARLAHRRRGARGARRPGEPGRDGAGRRHRTRPIDAGGRKRDRRRIVWARSMTGWWRSTPIRRRPGRPRSWRAWASRPRSSCAPAPNSPAAGACAWRWRRSCSQAPDLLLLDEPTNYLDLEGAAVARGIPAFAIAAPF